LKKNTLKQIQILAYLSVCLTVSSRTIAADNSDVIAADIKAANNFDTNGFDFQIAAGPVKPNAKSFAENYSCPEWFRDAKFGIYMHWGLNSVPGFNGHYARHMYTQQAPEAFKIDRETKRPVMSGHKPGLESVYQFHVKNFGHPSQVGYKDFIPLWKADKFDAAALTKLYKECGAKYIGAQAVHCDNFDLFDSTYQPWNSYRLGPKIDIVGEWKKACAKEKLRFAITSHLANGFHEHMFYQGETDATGPLAGVPYDTMDSKNDALYGRRTADRLRRLNPEFAQSWYRRSKELMDKYNPDLFYLDGPLPNGDYGLNLAAHFYNHYLAANGKPDGVFTIKKNSPAGFTLDVESAGIGEGMTQPWQVDTTINPGWFYLGADFKDATAGDDAGMSAGQTSAHGADRVRLTAGQVIDNLADIVSKNGNMMLNVGLRADGSLPETYRHELLDIGRWLKMNGEAIYATRPFKIFGEGPFQLPKASTQFNDNQYRYTAEDIRFTQSKDGKTLYAILLDWPTNQTITIKSLGSNALPTAKSVTLLANGKKLKLSQSVAGLQVTLPAKAVGEFAYVLKIKMSP
jgi:alpha-L-fucosidase